MKHLIPIVIGTLFMGAASSVVAYESTITYPERTGEHGVLHSTAEKVYFTQMTGFQEVPSYLSNGTGTFKATLDSTGTTLSYSLSFSNLSSPATVAHIHFGQMGVSGAPIAFLCGGNGKPACPINGATLTGTIVASDVIAVPAQGINAGDFSNLLAVIQSGNAYVNVHSAIRPSGEIRGQIKKKW